MGIKYFCKAAGHLCYVEAYGIANVCGNVTFKSGNFIWFKLIFRQLLKEGESLQGELGSFTPATVIRKELMR